MMTEHEKEILERMKYQRRKASGKFKEDFWIMTNQAFITAGLMGQGRLYFPLPGVIPIDEFIAEMQRRGYTVWKNKSETTLMVDMNLPKRAEDVWLIT